MVKDIKENEFNEVIKEGKVLVDCYATWCAPCQMLAPIIEEVSTMVSDYKFYKLDVDDSLELAQRYGIMSIPTLLIFENGTLKDKFIGFRSKEELLDLLK